MKHDKRRYLFIIKWGKVDGHSLVSYYKKMFGEFMALRSSIRIVHEKESWLILRVNHRYLEHARAAILVYGSGNLYTLLVSGTMRGLIRKLRTRIEAKNYVEQVVQAYVTHKRNIKES